MDNELVIDLSNEFEISFLTDEDEASKYLQKIDNLTERLTTYADTVNSFLTKLKSNPEASTIKWPDRLKDIEKLEAQLIKIQKGK